MTWVEFVAHVEKRLKEENIDPKKAEIWYIDISLSQDEVCVYIEPNLGISIS